jgi:hypothetical protein
MKAKLAVTIGLVALFAAMLGSSHAAPIVRANIPFQFIIEGKTLPAGEYDFVRSDNDQSVRIVSLKKGPSADALVLTRLGGGIHSTPKDTHIVFDKLGDTFVFSEFWIPGEDGYLLHSTKEKHSHRSVDVAN